MQAAIPKYELDRLYNFTGIGLSTISLIAYLILVISGITIFISLYKTVKERAFDLALLSSYGASNFQLIKMVAYEGSLIVLCAFVIGCVLEKFGISILFQYIETGYSQNMLAELSLEAMVRIVVLVFVVHVISVLLAIYPIVKMNISTILSNEK